MIVPKKRIDLEELIRDQVEESLYLEYKRSDALGKQNDKKREISKDVSAFANSAGGVLVYGIKEFDTDDIKHKPESISPIIREDFSREWLEQVIHSGISPKIENIIIYPISLSENGNEVAYAIEVPQSNTAHQVIGDGRYYRRNNFSVSFMLDYEIRDVMSRSKSPIMEMRFKVEKSKIDVNKGDYGYFMGGNPLYKNQPEYETRHKLTFYPRNSGKQLAEYVNYFIQFPTEIIKDQSLPKLSRISDRTSQFYGDNTIRDFSHKNGLVSVYGPSRFDPVLPLTNGPHQSIELDDHLKFDERIIAWTIHADNSDVRIGQIKLNELEIDETT